MDDWSTFQLKWSAFSFEYGFDMYLYNGNVGWQMVSSTEGEVQMGHV
jgi:hypothetical protein